jgi:RTX calcium-binding nonapeptide repeat (4 copies)
VRRALALLAAATALSIALAGTATPEGRIVIRGVPTGAHLRLTMIGSELSVTGPMEAAAGCRFSRGHGAATCPLDDVGSIEIDTGPAEDKIEVLERLSLPLTAYLGAGSDKLIGSGEADTCYPQGTDRNRCIGKGGNDVCISAPVNTDCVGGRGDDYCKTGSGSDGCWGGPGQDVCMMGDGQDGCHGEGGGDRLYGGDGGDRLYGGAGADYCDGGATGGRSRECEAGPRR